MTLYGFTFTPYVLHVNPETLKPAHMPLDVALNKDVFYFDPPPEFGKPRIDILYFIHTFLPTCDWSNLLAAKKKTGSSYEVEFISYKLSAEDATAFVEWANRNDKKVFELAERLGADGYKFSLSPDLDNECMLVSMTGTKHAARNTGLCMTSRADTFLEALLMCIYKHTVVFQSSDWDAAKTRQNWG